MTKANKQVCELCNGEASVYCCSDAAFLCWNCDDKVHGANFLVARHVRRTICSDCEAFNAKGYSGSFCRSCSPDAISSSSSSACNSSTDDVSSVPKKIDHLQIQSSSSPDNISLNSGDEVSSKFSGLPTVPDKKIQIQIPSGVLVNWCKELGVTNTSRDVMIDAFNRLRVFPYRVGLAASLWFSLRSSQRRVRDLNKLEEVSGVPAKLIVAAERTLKMTRKQRCHHHEEGWAEC